MGKLVSLCMISSKRSAKWLVLAFALCVSSAMARSQEDDKASWERGVRDLLGVQGSSYYTDEQLHEISQLVWNRAGAVQDQAIRSKLIDDTKRFVARNALSHTLLYVDIANSENGQPMTPIRTPSSWELSKYDLAKRIDYAVANPKQSESLPAIEAQIDTLASAIRTRISDICTGPGAADFIEQKLTSVKDELRYYAQCSLEYYLSKPMSAAELKQLEYKLATYVPSKTLDPDYQKDPYHVVIEDSKKPPYRAIEIVEGDILGGRVDAALEGLYRPSDFYDSRFKELEEKASSEFDVVSAKMGEKAKPRFIELRDNKPVDRGQSPQVKRGSGSSSGSSSAGSWKKDTSSKTTSGQDSRGAPVIAIVLVVLLVGIGLVFILRTRHAPTAK